MDYPDLQQFLGTRFHQHWDIEAGSAEEVVCQYLAVKARCERRDCIPQSSAVAAAHGKDLGSLLLEELSCHYDQTSEGLT